MDWRALHLQITSLIIGAGILSACGGGPGTTFPTENNVVVISKNGTYGYYDHRRNFCSFSNNYCGTGQAYGIHYSSGVTYFRGCDGYGQCRSTYPGYVVPSGGGGSYSGGGSSGGGYYSGGGSSGGGTSGGGSSNGSGTGSGDNYNNGSSNNNWNWGYNDNYNNGSSNNNWGYNNNYNNGSSNNNWNWGYNNNYNNGSSNNNWGYNNNYNNGSSNNNYWNYNNYNNGGNNWWNSGNNYNYGNYNNYNNGSNNNWGYNNYNNGSSNNWNNGWSSDSGTTDTDLQLAQAQGNARESRAQELSTEFQMDIESARQLTQVADKLKELSSSSSGLTLADQDAITHAALSVAGIDSHEVKEAVTQMVQNGDQKPISDLMNKAAANLGMPNATGLREKLLPALGIQF